MNYLVDNIDFFSLEHFSWALNLKLREVTRYSIFFYCRQSTLFQTFSTRRDILLVYESDSFLQSSRRFFFVLDMLIFGFVYKHRYLNKIHSNVILQWVFPNFYSKNPSKGRCSKFINPATSLVTATFYF